MYIVRIQHGQATLILGPGDCARLSRACDVAADHFGDHGDAQLQAHLRTAYTAFEGLAHALTAQNEIPFGELARLEEALEAAILS